MNVTPVHTTTKTILQFRFHYSDITEEHNDVDVENVMADTVNLGRKHSGLMDVHVQVRNERKKSDTGYMSITKATTKRTKSIHDIRRERGWSVQSRGRYKGYMKTC